MSDNNSIVLYFHCRNCRSGKLEVGITSEKKLQIWCPNCQMNVAVMELDATTISRLGGCSECGGTHVHEH